VKREPRGALSRGRRAFCFVIDVGGFILFYHFGVVVLPASVMSFVAATLANYGLCRAFVFQAGRFARANEILRLFAVSAAGVALNSVVWVLADVAMVDPRIAKITAVLPMRD
jgi:putative flippase GtrA